MARFRFVLLDIRVARRTGAVIERLARRRYRRRRTCRRDWRDRRDCPIIPAARRRARGSSRRDIFPRRTSRPPEGLRLLPPQHFRREPQIAPPRAPPTRFGAPVFTAGVM